jgi:endonuclease-8
VLELLTESRSRFDRRLAMLGPDILAPQLDEAEILRRLRADDQTRAIGDALLDQRTIAGIGNLWKCEACFGTRIDPWRRTADITDDEARELVRWARPRMAESARTGMQDKFRVVYKAAGRPCPRCGTIIRQRGQGDDNRPTYWCPGCQS